MLPKWDFDVGSKQASKAHLLSTFNQIEGWCLCRPGKVCMAERRADRMMHIRFPVTA